ncbi:hypothetical protein B0H16DRAFT_1461252 [Mycena metata]|uniref:Uncharacterized protein n=1 Tax=Mycena metata TaxID=1033252 RepID=A0AAD7ISB6_9AGAR|nr:hypothetical protein B0H16DRAFT_1461252 [Mycena metata]
MPFECASLDAGNRRHMRSDCATYLAERGLQPIELEAAWTTGNAKSPLRRKGGRKFRLVSIGRVNGGWEGPLGLAGRRDLMGPRSFEKQSLMSTRSCEQSDSNFAPDGYGRFGVSCVGAPLGVRRLDAIEKPKGPVESLNAISFEVLMNSSFVVVQRTRRNVQSPDQPEEGGGAQREEQINFERVSNSRVLEQSERMPLGGRVGANISRVSIDWVGRRQAAATEGSAELISIFLALDDGGSEQGALMVAVQNTATHCFSSVRPTPSATTVRHNRPPQPASSQPSDAHDLLRALTYPAFLALLVYWRWIIFG